MHNYKETMSTLECQIHHSTKHQNDLEDDCHKLREALADLEEKNRDDAIEIKVLEKEKTEE